jgi:hypothetical protein
MHKWFFFILIGIIVYRYFILAPDCSTYISDLVILPSPDKVPEPADNAEAKAAPAAEDIPAAGQDAASRPDEHQRGHLGQAAQEEHQPHQERRPGQQGPGFFR